MGTTIEAVAVTSGGRHRPGALALTDRAARACLEAAAVSPSDVELLINAGLYRDRNLGEPALAALIQEDVGINAEDPHPGGHGSFSFDVANGACGVLTAMQIADRFLRAGTIERALLVTADADPGHHLAPGFPFAAAGGAVSCTHEPGERGLIDMRWGSWPDDGETWRATVGTDTGRNLLHIDVNDAFYERAGTAAAKIAVELLDSAGTLVTDISVVVAAPSQVDFVRALAAHSGIDDERVLTAPSSGLHTVAFVSALDRAWDEGLLTRNGMALFVCAGAGITTGAALYAT
jgi:3-oxoacyl-[acyl-carrier-protein] synthase-3